jgi:hypothetical protein
MTEDDSIKGQDTHVVELVQGVTSDKRFTNCYIHVSAPELISEEKTRTVEDFFSHGKYVYRIAHNTLL